jgi:hypothetical protein
LGGSWLRDPPPQHAQHGLEHEKQASYEENKKNCSSSSNLSLLPSPRARVVKLGIRRLTGRRVGVLAHYIRHKPGILDIFSEYSLKITQICSNILEYFFVR